MVAYSFQKRFPPLILSGRKSHTLRGPRRRHARVGEGVQLYQSMRTKSCKLVAEPVCDRFHGVLLKFNEWQAFDLFDVAEQEPGIWRRVGDLRPIENPDAFAYSDGFDDIDDMGRFWLDTHGVRMWDGFLIGWPALSPGAAP